jgi:Cu/Ag efflux protein CusF
VTRRIVPESKGESSKKAPRTPDFSVLTDALNFHTPATSKKLNGSTHNPTEEDTMKKLLLSSIAVAVALAFTLPLRAEDAKTEKPSPKQFTGVIESVDAKDGTITLKKKDESKTFKLGDKAKISTKDKEVAELSDLKAGDKVTVHFTEQDGKAVASKINPPVSKKKTEAPAEKPAQ